MQFLSVIASKIFESLVAPVGQWLSECTIAPIGQWLCCLFYYSSNIENLRKQKDELKHKRKRVQHSVDGAIRNAEEIEADVNSWLEKVDVIMGNAEEVLEAEEKANRGGSIGTCLNLKQRHQQSKKAMKIVQEIEAQKNRKFDKVSYRPALPGIMTKANKDYMTFDSRVSTVEGLMEALRDANINMIGVWGMPGVGKTTLVREVANQVKENKLFDDVAIAEVTESPDMRRIQEELAGTLDLKFDIVEPVTVRANRLWQRLTTKHNKILVILDDVWEKLEWEKIGIPVTDCKVVITSRDKDLLSCEMGTQKNFGLGVLTEEEAWNLFEKMAGDSVKDPNLRNTATEVAKECAGLPIALVTVSKGLKNKSLYEWKDALKQLRRPAPGHLSKMQSTIYSSIELSCSHLESDEAKTFFLFCSQRQYSIGYLDMLKFCYGWGLFPNINTVEEARNRLYRQVRNLRDSSLLLDCPNTHDHFHMHDVVRDASILIASKDEHNMFLVRDDRELKERIDMDALKKCRALSIFGGDIHELPNEMECPELRLLYVNGGDKSLQIIPETFFDGMRKLKVLDFTQMQLSSLPSSLHLLSNLTTLCLDFCAFEDMAVIGEFKNLEILSLIGSNVSQLPREIGLLTHLRLLDLSKCSKLEVIPRNVLSSLVELEELYMGNSFDHWETEGLNNGRNNATLAELMHLSHLVTLEIHIRDASVLPKDLLLFKKLERYRICVGDVWDWVEKRETSRRLKLKLNTSFQLECGIKMLLNGVEDLWLDELKGVKSILYELDTEGFQQLKHLEVQNNAEIKYIIYSSVWLIVFPALETFSLKNLINLEEICHAQLHSKSFGNLRVVKFENCNKLKFVFSLSIAKELSQLRELEIRECSIMGAIVIKEEPEIEGKEIDMTLFPQLRVLTVQHLPKLVSFFSTQNSFITNVGEITPEGDHDFPMPILHEQVVFPSLERLELSSISEEIQHNQHQAGSSSKLTNTQAFRFLNLSYLEVRGSGSLKYLFSSSTEKFMGQLKHLHILECKVMEEILLIEDSGEEEIIPNVLFPRLECLMLKDLPTLKSFCIKCNIEFPCLKNLRILDCPNLKTFISETTSSSTEVIEEVKELNSGEISHIALPPLFNEEVVFPSLDLLEMSPIDLEEIQHNQHQTRSSCKLTNMQASMRFQNLLTLEVNDFGSLKYLLPFSTAKFMVQLKHLHISECKVMEEILLTEDLGGEEIILGELFPRLECMKLKDLPILKRFCMGSNIEFPSLKLLLIENCPKLKSFIFKPFSSAEKDSKEVEELNSEEMPHTALQPFFNEGVVFPNLEELELTSIDLEEIQQNQHCARSSFIIKNIPTMPRFKNLCSWKVKGSTSLKYLLSSSTAKFMVQLKYLFIEGCKLMEEVLLTEDLGEEAIIPKVLFPRLEELRLIDLPILQRFCVGSNIKFQSLTGLMIEKCPKLKSFIFKPVNSGMIVIKELNEMNSDEITYIATQPLFNEEVAFPSLEKLKISHMEKLKIIWHNQADEDSFFKLKILVVECCENLMNIFQSNMLTRFQSLEKLIVGDCGSLQEIFKLQGQDVREAHGVTTIPLKELSLRLLPKIRHVWDKDPQGFFSFQNLQLITVEKCESLKSLFPVSIARILLQLEKLVIVDCGVEDIVASEDGVEATTRFVFPKVTRLILRKVPKLKWFYQQMHTSEWPLLKEFNLCGCDQIEIFVSKILSLQEMVEQSQLETSLQPLFSVGEVAFPSLEDLRICHIESLKIIWHIQLIEDSFFKLQKLDVVSCENLTNIFQSNMLTRFQSLKILIVSECPSLQEIFELEGQDVRETYAGEIIPECDLDFHMPILLDQEKHARVLTKQRGLALTELHMLTHLWKEDTQLSPIFHYLEDLNVTLCGKLKILVPASVSFQNLTNLEILKCHGLINLVTPSTAKSLVQLKKLSVSECKSITEVVAGEGGEGNGVITFSQLTYLKLDCLPNLTSFCSRSNSFEFPSLEEVIVSKCPKMKIFCHGILSTPKLERVQATKEDEWHWKVDLNTTVCRLALEGQTMIPLCNSSSE